MINFTEAFKEACFELMEEQEISALIYNVNELSKTLRE